MTVLMSSKICLLEDYWSRPFCTVIQTIWMGKKKQPTTINETFFSWNQGKSDRISEVGRDLRWSLVQPPVQSRTSYGIRPACSWLCPVVTWKPLRTNKNFTGSVRNLFHCSTVLMRKKLSLIAFSCLNISFQFIMPIIFCVPTTHQSPW